jgi:hypothetical protein
MGAAMLVALIEACGASDVPILGDGTRPPDGAPGACCKPKTGGCADTGGYRADGDCRLGYLCDNMCEQRIVDDEHGCKKMVYKIPRVATTFAGTGSCDSPAFNGGPSADGGMDATADAAAD